MVLKESKPVDVELPSLASFLSAIQYSSIQLEESNVVYVDIVSLPADSKDTVLRFLRGLHTIQLQFRWLMVVSDAKTCAILQGLRHQYGSQMQWLLPFPGDWHILYNYQKVLLKICDEAGLLQLAGHRAETLSSLAQASHFKRTHHFIMQSFEAIYRFLIHTCFENNSSMTEVMTSSASTLANTLSSLTNESDLDDFHETLNTSLNTTLLECSRQFNSFMATLCKNT